MEFTQVAYKTYYTVRKGVELNDRVNSVLDYLKEHGRSKFADIIKSVGYITVSQGRSLFSKLVSKGIVTADYAVKEGAFVERKRRMWYVVNRYDGSKIYECFYSHDENDQLVTKTNVDYWNYVRAHHDCQFGEDMVVDRIPIKEVYYTYVGR